MLYPFSKFIDPILWLSPIAQVARVRRAVCDAVTELGLVLCTKAAITWPELPPKLFELAASQVEGPRESAVII